MNTSTATAPKIKLQRGMAGWYVYYSADLKHTFDIHKITTGMWAIKHKVGHRENATTENWTVANLDAARALIAALI